MVEQVLVISFKIIGVQKKENPPARLVANTAFLRFGRSFCQQQRTFVCALWCNQNPPFCVRQNGVFGQPKMQFLGIKFYCFVVIVHYYGDVCQTLVHFLWVKM